MGPALALLLTLQALPVEPLVEKGLKVVKARAAENPEFALWVLVYCQTPQTDPTLRSLLKDLLDKPPTTTKSAALQAMILDDLDRFGYRPRIAHCAQFLIDNQCDDGRWDDGKPVQAPDVPPLPPTPDPERPRSARDFAGPPPIRKVVALKISRVGSGAKTGDSVLSRWAAWGLLACHQAGMLPPQDVVDKAAVAWTKGDHDPADVVTGLSICRYLSKRDWKKDPDILKAVDRLAAKEANDPASLFLTKRAMIHFDKATLGGREWWPDGVTVLSASQKPDGSWGSLEETCCATYFLHLPRVRWFHDPDRR